MNKTRSEIALHETTLTWKNLNASIGQKVIIQNSSGYCRPREMLAIMGPSGAGKTTLLSLISAKSDPALTISGQVQANKQSFNQQTFYDFGGFVFQSDILHQTLTVTQTLMFSARMKFKDIRQAEERVDELIRDFQLQKCKDTYVGGKIIKGISGGQKKRVCIAIQMVNKPSLLVLDEPTSGLDSHIAGRVMKVLKKLANEGKTIIFTIHQPSYLLYSMLDKLILLDRGSTIYQGNAKDIGNYMHNLGITLSTKMTISDFFMFQISTYNAKKNSYSTKLTKQSYNLHQAPSMQAQWTKVYQSNQQGYFMPTTIQPFFTQFHLLLHRQLIVFKRNPMKLYRALGNAVISIILCGVIFLNTIPDNCPKQNEEGYYELLTDFIWIQSTCFNVSTFTIMNGIFSVALVFPAERQVYSKQTVNKTYDTLPYFLSKILVETSSLLLGALIFGAGVYWLIGFTSDPSKFFIFCFIILCLSIVANSIGFMVGSLFKDAVRASALSPAFLLPLMMFSGLYNKTQSIPQWIAWMQYISPFKYGLQSIIVNEYGTKSFHAKPPIIPQPFPLPQYYDYRADLGFNLSVMESLGVCLGIALFFYILAFIFLKQQAKTISA